VSEPAGAEPSTEAQAAMVATDLPANYFELYKLAVETADRISARRGIANSFFLTANTGIVFAGAWWALLRGYRDLNSAKFEIILAMEERLPVRVYGDEWDRLRREPLRFSLRRDARRAWLAQYRELGRVERIVPWIFALIYAAEIVRQLAA